MIRIEQDSGGDWMRVFVNGELKFCGHEIELDHLLRLAGVDYEIVEGTFAGRGFADDTFTPYDV